MNSRLRDDPSLSRKALELNMNRSREALLGQLELDIDDISGNQEKLNKQVQDLHDFTKEYKRYCNDVINHLLANGCKSVTNDLMKDRVDLCKEVNQKIKLINLYLNDLNVQPRSLLSSGASTPDRRRVDKPETAKADAAANVIAATNVYTEKAETKNNVSTNVSTNESTTAADAAFNENTAAADAATNENTAVADAALIQLTATEDAAPTEEELRISYSSNSKSLPQQAGAVPKRTQHNGLPLNNVVWPSTMAENTHSHRLVSSSLDRLVSSSLDTSNRSSSRVTSQNLVSQTIVGSDSTNDLVYTQTASTIQPRMRRLELGNNANATSQVVTQSAQTSFKGYELRNISSNDFKPTTTQVVATHQVDRSEINSQNNLLMGSRLVEDKVANLNIRGNQTTEKGYLHQVPYAKVYQDQVHRPNIAGLFAQTRQDPGSNDETPHTSFDAGLFAQRQPGYRPTTNPYGVPKDTYTSHITFNPNANVYPYNTAPNPQVQQGQQPTINAYGSSQPMHAPNPTPNPNINTHPYTPFTQAHNTTHHTISNNTMDAATMQLLRQGVLQVPKNTYNGEPHLFQSFINQLNSHIQGIPLTPWDHMCVLEARTTGHPQRIVQSHMNSGNPDPQRTLNELYSELYRRFGSGNRVAHTLTSKLNAFQPIKSADQTDKLEELLEICKSIRNNLHLQELQEFNISTGIQKIWSKLPSPFQNAWRSQNLDYSRRNYGQHPPLAHFIDFLTTKFEEYSDPAYERRPIEVSKRVYKEHKTFKTDVPNEEQTPTNNPGASCLIHTSAQHKMQDCKKFKNFNDDEKYAFMRKNDMCFKCLGKHRQNKCKETPKCEKCSRKHLTVLHRESFPERRENANERPTGSSDEANGSTSLCTRVCGDGQRHMSCSKTLLVDVTWPEKSSKRLRCYAIVDEQSSSSFADPKLAKFFGIDAPKTKYHLTTLSGLRTTVHGIQIQGLKVKGVGEKRSFKLPTLVTNEAIPNNRDEVASPATVRAHPHISHYAKFFNDVDDNAETLLLIGRDSNDGIFTKQHGQKAPYVHHTRLGWALVGNVCTATTNANERKVLRTTIDHEHFHSENCFPLVKDADQKRLAVDPFDQHPDDEMPALSQNEQRFMDKVLNDIHINDEGNITLPLPMKNEDTNFPDNKQAILNRTRNTLNRLKRDADKLQKSLNAMNEHLDLKHVERVPKGDKTKNSKDVWYIPIFPISKKEKARLVFDSSATFQGTSLNGSLLTGPDFNNRLRSVLLRFRMEDIGISADISSMFYCFHLEPKDRDKTRFFWFKDNDPNNELVEYRARVHLFGNSSSPALAILGLRFAVNNDTTNTPQEVKDFIKNNFYVDDGLKSTKTHQEAVSILSKTIDTLSKYNIRLHKISSNSEEVINAFPSSELSQTPPKLSGTATQPTLGLRWDTVNDYLVIQMNVPEHPLTRRGVLATVNSIFDPLGFVAPVILTGRILQRKLLQVNNDSDEESTIDWDSPLSDSCIDEWNEWKKSLTSIEGLKIPRCYHPKNFGTPESVELHVFSDASMQATGHVMYLRYRNKDRLHVGLVTANSKVTPRAANTVPRLELCAALDASIAAKEVARALDINHDHIFLHTDSTVVLGYIGNTDRRFSGYVTRRVNMILKHFNKEKWSYVTTEDNPADIASRPQTVESLLRSCWFEGPKCLREDDKDTPPAYSEETSELPETILEAKNLLSKSRQDNDIFTTLLERASSYERVIRTLKRIISFSQYLLDTSRQKKGIQLAPRRNITDEQAEHILIKSVQIEAFPLTHNTLQHNKQLPLNDPLLPYAPFLSSDGLLRVGGRLRHSHLPPNQKFPILLPTNHNITTLIIHKCHNRIRHQGRILTQGAIRDEGYYIHRGSTVIDKFLKGCVTCQRLRGPFIQQVMSDLPADRLAATPPFTNTGMDVFGPYLVKQGVKTRRNAGTRKMWAIVFTCLVSRAIHIEPLPSLDISAFKNAFRRFTCLRGQCKILRSDRGTNFVGAANQDDRLDLLEVEKELKTQQIEWIFNPPRAPHFGGVFERKVGSIKRIIDACLLQLGPHRVLTDDELYTFLAEATSIINHTPLTAISSDPNDPVPISPATILLQREKVEPVPADILTEADLLSYGSRRWKRVQYLATQFWQRWRQEYLQTLTTRKKWQIPGRSLVPGDIVLVRDSSSARNQWPIGRVRSVKTSKDGRVRSVTLNLPRRGDNKERTCERPISELVLLLKSDSQI